MCLSHCLGLFRILAQDSISSWGFCLTARRSGFRPIYKGLLWFLYLCYLLFGGVVFYGLSNFIFDALFRVLIVNNKSHKNQKMNMKLNSTQLNPTRAHQRFSRQTDKRRVHSMVVFPRDPLCFLIYVPDLFLNTLFYFYSTLEKYFTSLGMWCEGKEPELCLKLIFSQSRNVALSE